MCSTRLESNISRFHTPGMPSHDGDGFAAMQLKGHVFHRLNAAALDLERYGDFSRVDQQLLLLVFEIEPRFWRKIFNLIHLKAPFQ